MAPLHTQTNHHFYYCERKKILMYKNKPSLPEQLASRLLRANQFSLPSVAEVIHGVDDLFISETSLSIDSIGGVSPGINIWGWGEGG